MTKSSNESRALAWVRLANGGALGSLQRQARASGIKNGMAYFVLCLPSCTTPVPSLLVVTLLSGGKEQLSATMDGWHGQRTASSPCMCVCVCVCVGQQRAQWKPPRVLFEQSAVGRVTNDATCGETRAVELLPLS
ncbi:hypothetical protein LX32DRAFT_441635 [Colletotrichum zoysiae]|uniref:Uncharacterized protein n=1 Tax=Colletotrichum zoysiae TaxID=1216348 RepID=A0AAD9HUH4_9PEZI|nr:hypothetical protein LX32DRAFT_441635 [Colletotrichum zoysiae]